MTPLAYIALFGWPLLVIVPMAMWPELAALRDEAHSLIAGGPTTPAAVR